MSQALWFTQEEKARASFLGKVRTELSGGDETKKWESEF